MHQSFNLCCRGMQHLPCTSAGCWVAAGDWALACKLLTAPMPSLKSHLVPPAVAAAFFSCSQAGRPAQQLHGSCTGCAWLCYRALHSSCVRGPDSA